MNRIKKPAHKGLSLYQHIDTRLVNVYTAQINYHSRRLVGSILVSVVHTSGLDTTYKIHAVLKPL